MTGTKTPLTGTAPELAPELRAVLTQRGVAQVVRDRLVTRVRFADEQVGSVRRFDERLGPGAIA